MNGIAIAHIAPPLLLTARCHVYFFRYAQQQPNNGDALVQLECYLS